MRDLQALAREYDDPTSREGPRPRFRVLTMTELLALEPPAWLLSGYLPLNGLGVLYGAPGTGKSFLSIAWSLSIAAGRPWLDCATKPGSVLYVGAEGGTGLGQRVRAYCDAHELAPPNSIRFIHEAVNLLELGDVDALLAITERPALVVIDTLSRCMAGGDENSAQDIGRVIAAADRIRHTLGAAILIVHHTTKTGELERGSSALRGAADAMFALTSENAVITLSCSKQKDAPEPAGRQLQLRVSGKSCVIEPLEGPAPTIGPSVRRLLQAIREVSIEGETSASILIDPPRLPKSTVYKNLKNALEAGYITKRGQKYALTPAGEAECLVSLK